ncbi:hypothetical protein FVB9288_02450 [Flavobacterium sp. CECT 9288]|uniref:DUF3667 domain-containing protein n=1 Tax=Flavobacterium sp. CECT 9288 TaxID=2845819 RepID=UPI001E391F51|nr:DUF3667 domain-containing protein [Flavobacterium sp. CECT 9288]CAH0336737.1 hypothetical protein FVB9288_02450 [Flavobacterium sp. CECT 9288]
MNCNNCNQELTSKYCPECGQPAELKRINGHYIIHEIEHVLHFERGILFTVKELLVNPGKNIRDYFTQNRTRLVKPVIFIIVTSLIYTILNNFFNLEDGYVKYQGAQNDTTSIIVKWLQGHYGYANILMGVLIAMWLKIFFKKSSYNFYEILIMLCFVLGMAMLIFSVFVIIEGVTHFKIMTFAGAVGILYSSWAVGDFFNKGKVMSYIKALGAYLLGMIFFWVIPVVIGILIDLVNKN